jgi:hypothetical protein
MSLVLPPLTDMVRADEYTLTMEQELRLLDDRERRSRWWAAPEDTPAPGPAVTATTAPDLARLTDPWPEGWLQLNEPAEDSMVGVCVLNEADASQGILILVDPTETARELWQAAWDRTAWVPTMLGVETGIAVPAPEVDYRCVFRNVHPLAQITPGSVRWKFSRPAPGVPAWDVMTAGHWPGPRRRTW